MRITKQHIKTIDNYLKKDIKYWDVRLELIDHLASKLEECDDVTLDDVFLKIEFGSSSRIRKTQKRRTKLINKKYRKLIFSGFLSFFKSFKNSVILSLVVLIEICLSSIFENKFVLKINIYVSVLSALFLFYFIFKKSVFLKKSYTNDIIFFYLTLPMLFFGSILEVSKNLLSHNTYSTIIIGYIILSTIWMLCSFKIFIKMNTEYSKIHKQYLSL